MPGLGGGGGSNSSNSSNSGSSLPPNGSIILPKPFKPFKTFDPAQQDGELHKKGIKPRQNNGHGHSSNGAHLHGNNLHVESGTGNARSSDWALRDLERIVRDKLLRFLCILGTQTFSHAAFTIVSTPLFQWGSLSHKERKNGIFALEILRSVLLTSAQVHTPQEYLHFPEVDAASLPQESQNFGVLGEDLLSWPAEGFTFGIWFREQGPTISPGESITPPSVHTPREREMPPASLDFDSILFQELRGDTSVPGMTSTNGVSGARPRRNSETPAVTCPPRRTVLWSMRNQQTGEGIEVSLEHKGVTSADANGIIKLCRNIVVEAFKAGNNAKGELVDMVKVHNELFTTSCAQKSSGWHWISVVLDPPSFSFSNPRLSIYVDARRLRTERIGLPNFSKNIARFSTSVCASALGAKSFAEDAMPFYGQMARAILLKKALSEDDVRNLCDLHTRPDGSGLFPAGLLESSEPFEAQEEAKSPSGTGAGGLGPIDAVAAAAANAPWASSSFNPSESSGDLSSAGTTTQVYLPTAATSVPYDMYSSSFGSLQQTWDTIRTDAREQLVTHTSAKRWRRLPPALHAATVFSWDAKHVQRALTMRGMVYCTDLSASGFKGVFMQDCARVVHRRLLSDVLASVGGMRSLFPLLLETVHDAAHAMRMTCDVDAGLATRVISLLADLVSFELCLGTSQRRAGHVWIVQGEGLLNLLRAVLVSCCADALVSELVMALASLVDATSLLYCRSTNHGNLFFLWDLLRSPSTEVQILAIELVHVYAIRTGGSLEPKGLSDGRSIDAPTGPFRFDVEHASLMQDYLTKSSAALPSLQVVDALLAFALGADFDADGLCTASSLESSDLSFEGEVVFPLALRVVFGLLLSPKTSEEVQLAGLKRVNRLLVLSNPRMRAHNRTLRQRQSSFGGGDNFVLVDEPEMPLVSGDIDRLTVLCIDLCCALKTLAANEDHGDLVEVLCTCVKKVCAELNSSESAFSNDIVRLIRCDWLPEQDDLGWGYSETSESLFPLSWVEGAETERLRTHLLHEEHLFDCFHLLHREARVHWLERGVQTLSSKRKELARQLDTQAKQK
ncbi:BEACH domain-containing protein C2 [Hondaea fermentalgiana]|uniref:BEACH domain-containing protein C2 n=1 Tax=Hondaea fermentalgiana TaxID=2315210 RepID=A0A2R5GNP2_9STRA|nr:BEACH domain-containing protein C2 [Hondaea fermentalgiana]|eukprot:GBG32500.1 BEACH domain-containing protein C2 [Hondaea fermentalgiana]